MPFPRDPNAPGGPRRSEYLRSSFAVVGARPADRLDSADVSIRLAMPDEDEREPLRRLASLDDRPVPSEPVVLAEINGESVAALGLRAGEALTDPTRASSGLMALLHLRRLEALLIISIFGA